LEDEQMADAQTERRRAIATDLDASTKTWWDDGFREGLKAGADAERARIQAVEAQSMPGHEALVAKLKFDGKTTGGEAAVLIIAAERKLRGGFAADLQTEAPRTTHDFPSESTTRVIQKVDATMSDEQVAAVAKDEWQQNPKLAREFTSENAYIAFRKAEAAGRIRVMLDRKEN
jgi:capsid assembly protease